jgi:hypothetical protein
MIGALSSEPAPVEWPSLPVAATEPAGRAIEQPSRTSAVVGRALGVVAVAALIIVGARTHHANAPPDVPLPATASDDLANPRHHLSEAAASPGPSFDYAKARSPAERLICSDPQLSGRLYAIAYRSTSDKNSFKRESRAALQQRERDCRDKDCLVHWYTEREGFPQDLRSKSLGSDSVRDR